MSHSSYYQPQGIEETAENYDGPWPVLVKPLLALCAEKDVKVVQVKEKFGTLRFYYAFPEGEVVDAPTKELVSSLIRAAERLSSVMCDVCCGPGKYRNDRSWVRTLCDEHAAKRDEIGG